MAGRIRAFLLPAIIALILLGPVFAVIAVIYLTHSAADLPQFFPGHQAGSAKHHNEAGLASIALAVVSWIAAFAAIRLRAGKVPAFVLRLLPPSATRQRNPTH